MIYYYYHYYYTYIYINHCFWPMRIGTSPAARSWFCRCVSGTDPDPTW